MPRAFAARFEHWILCLSAEGLKMKELETGYIVAVAQMEGLYVVLEVDPIDRAVVLLSRDGQKRTLRGIPFELVQVMPEQLLAWASQPHVPSRHSNTACAIRKQRDTQAATE